MTSFRLRKATNIVGSKIYTGFMVDPKIHKITRLFEELGNCKKNFAKASLSKKEKRFTLFEKIFSLFGKIEGIRFVQELRREVIE